MVRLRTVSQVKLNVGMKLRNLTLIAEKSFYFPQRQRPHAGGWIVEDENGVQRHVETTILKRMTYEKEPCGDHSAATNQRYRNYKKSARERGHDFNLSLEDFKVLIAEDCTYCGVAPSKYTNYKHTKSEIFQNGIDRVDNAVGYSKENCVTSCSYCNYAKRNRSVEEFKAWLEQLFAHMTAKKSLPTSD